MRLGRLLALCLLILVAGQTTTPAAEQEETAFDRLFREYAAGDHEVIARRLRTLGDYDLIRRDLQRARVAWRQQWKPVHAMFLFDLAVTSMERRWAHLYRDLIDTARAFVVSRGAPGEDAELDAFEIAWHTAMLSALLSVLQTTDIDDYLRRIRERMTPTRIERAPTLVAPHIVLIEATSREQLTTPDSIAIEGRTATAPLTMLTADRTTRRRAEEAIALFEAAAGFDGTAAEALIRKGFLLHRLGRHEAALEAFDAASGRGDRVARYLNELFRARALESLDRRTDAAGAYEAAHRAWPEAQAPMIALVTLHVRSGRRDEALRWTATLNAMPDDAYDPWWDYWYGDGRNFPRRRAALRQAVR